MVAYSHHFLFLVWVFDIPPLFAKCDLTPEECLYQGHTPDKEFNHTVYAPNTILVSCEPGMWPMSSLQK